MSTTIVLDCSTTLSWFFPDEEGADAVLDALNAGGVAWVPQHWGLEVGNTLLMGERRGRCTQAESAHFLGILSSLAIRVDGTTASVSTSVGLALAREHGLTVYDAAYLELAMRRRLPLATLDRALRKAAARVGVTCVPA